MTREKLVNRDEESTTSDLAYEYFSEEINERIKSEGSVEDVLREYVYNNFHDFYKTHEFHNIDISAFKPDFNLEYTFKYFIEVVTYIGNWKRRDNGNSNPYIVLKDTKSNNMYVVKVPNMRITNSILKNFMNARYQ